jgi:hypothetical protein
MVEPSLSIDESAAASGVVALSAALASGFMLPASAAESTAEPSVRAPSFAVASGRLVDTSASPPSSPEIVVGAQALTTTAGTNQSQEERFMLFKR